MFYSGNVMEKDKCFGKEQIILIERIVKKHFFLLNVLEKISRMRRKLLSDVVAKYAINIFDKGMKIDNIYAFG